MTKLWSGAGPTIVRAALINMGQLGVYSEAKQWLQKGCGLSGVPLQFVASLISATAAVSLSCPADVVKSRMQMSKPGAYSGVVDCVRRTVRHEGVGALWKGFGPGVTKVAPHTVISFIILENLSKMVLKKDAF